MGKKKTPEKSKPLPTSTQDIRRFFDSSSLEQASKQQSKQQLSSSKDRNTGSINMAPKRKKTNVIYSSDDSDGEQIQIKKKKIKKNGQEEENQKSSKKSVKKKKAESDSEDDYKPVAKKSKTSKTSSKSSSKKKKKSESDSEDDYSDDYKPKAKKATAVKKSTATKKTTTTKKSAAKSKGKLVKQIDCESTDNEDYVECTMVNKKENTLAGFHVRIDGDQAKLNQKSLMWVDKYKPKCVSEIIGQHTPKSPANKLRNWLMNWHANYKIQMKPGTKSDTGYGYKAALLSGLPGIGKTTTATLLAKECGYDFIELNASDTRNKKSMDEHIKSLLDNKTLAGYVHDPNHKTKMADKHLIIMDEVDGVSGNADRSGITELIQFIKKTKIPIICICNDRQHQKIRTLANYCFDVRFQKIRTDNIVKYINSACVKESVKIDPKLLLEIIEMSNFDIRQILHYVSVFSVKTKHITDIKENKVIKTVALNPFTCCHKIFTDDAEYDSMSFREKSDLFFVDYNLIPLFAWQNYIQCNPTDASNESEKLERAVKSINSICFGDMIETEIKTKQTWNLLPLQACFSTVMPGYYMNGHFGGQIEFPSILGKISSTNKKNRLVTELKQHMNLKITGSKSCLSLDYMTTLRDKIIGPLIDNEEDAILKSIAILNHYDLLKDDLDSIIELSLWGDKNKNPYLSVETKLKTALTRTFNKTIHPLPYSIKEAFKKKGEKAVSKKKADKDDDEDDGDEEKEVDKDDLLIPEF